MLAVATVTTPLDVIDFGDGVTSLREALFATNTLAGADRIEFDISLDGATIDLNFALGELAITDSLTIDASGLAGGITIDAGNGTDGLFATADGIRIFSIDDAALGYAVVVLDGLTLTGADVGPSSNLGKGGAINNIEDLTLINSTVTGNAAISGGGLANFGSAWIERSTFSENSADAGVGGGISSSADLTVLASTITENGAHKGGGIYASHRINISSCTIAGNTAGFVGGGLVTYGDATITNSTVTGNSAQRGGGLYGGGAIAKIARSLTTPPTTSPEASSREIR